MLPQSIHVADGIPQEVCQYELIEYLKNETSRGRSLVPLLGAGASVEAGIPHLGGVCRYLAKVRFSLRLSLYRHETTPLASWANDDTLRSYPNLPNLEIDPREYLSQHGWPDPHQLHADLWAALREVRAKRSLNYAIESEFLATLGTLDLTLEEKLCGIRGGDKPLELKPNYWKLLLTQLTGSNPDLIDTLFRRLTFMRDPSLAHRYLAFLAAPLRIRLFLTLNFDDMLEDALRSERLFPTVYSIAEGTTTLPSPRLVWDELAIIKLHGSDFGLRVGDALDRPIDADTRERLKAYLPSRPILLCIGLGGWDTRILDLVRIAQEKGGEVCWLHFEDNVPTPIANKLGHVDRTCRVRRPSAFLQDLYSTYKLIHPPSSIPYKSMNRQPILVGDRPVVELPSSGGSFLLVAEDGDHERDFAQHLSVVVDGLAATHLPIWVDIATKFTVEDVVVEIIKQLRRYDPEIPPEILAIEKSGNYESFKKVVARLLAALSRGAYVLAVNGTVAFGRRPTRHHVRDSSDDADELSLRTAPLLDFLQALIGLGLGEEGSLRYSDLIIVVNYGGAVPVENAEVRRKYRELRHLFTKETLCKCAGDADDRAPRLTAETESEPVMLLLAAFRRRRSRIALTQLLPKYCKLSGSRLEDEWDSKTVDKVIAGFMEKGILANVEGGYYWMPRTLRDEIYDRVRTATGSEMSASVRVRAIAVLAFTHRDLADYYRWSVFCNSRSVAALLEEIYHRIAYVRYLRRLVDEAEQSIDASAWPCGVERRLAVAPDSDEFSSEGVGPLLNHDGERVNSEAVTRLHMTALKQVKRIIVGEKEELLAGVPSATLLQWIQQIRYCDVDEMLLDGCEDPEADSEAEQLVEALDDLEALVLEDRLQNDRIIALRLSWIRWFVRSAEEEQDRWWRVAKEHAFDEGSVHAAESQASGLRPLLKRVRDRAKGEHTARVERALLQVAVALDGSQRTDLADDVLNCVAEIIEASRSGNQPFAAKRACAESMCLVVEADIRLSRVCRSATLPAGDLRSRDEDLRVVFEKCGRVIDGLNESGVVDTAHRATAFSIRARARTVRGEFSEAYRDYDLARAGLRESNPRDKDALIMVSMRRIESLIRHSSADVSIWCLERLNEEIGKMPSGDLDPEEVYEAAVSQQAAVTNRASVVRPKELLSMSLGNWHCDTLARFDSGIRERGSVYEDWRGVSEAMHRRLLTASDALDQVQILLEGSRKKTRWWSCLFQLRAHLAVERLLLLLAEPTTLASIRDFGWLGISVGEIDVSPRVREAYIERLRPVLINEFVGLVRDGVRAVRQGLDILLPEIRDRDDLMADELLRSHLELWVRLLVAGAAVTEVARGFRSRDDVKRLEESRRRWEDWERYNRWAGIFKLPRCKRVKQLHDRTDWRQFDEFGIESRSRAVAIAQRWIERPEDRVLPKLVKELCK